MPKPFAQMPGPRGVPLLGSAIHYTRLGRHSFERLFLAKQENYARFGRVYRERLGAGVTVVQVFDPDDAAAVFRADGRHPLRPALPITAVAQRRDGLSLGLGSLNGAEWYELRSAVQKMMMHPRAAASYLPAQNAVADDFLKLLRMQQDQRGFVPDFHELIIKYTMESIGTVCFNSRLGCLLPCLSPDSEATHMLRASAEMFSAVQKTTFAFPWYAMFRTPLYRQFIDGKRICDRIARAHIANIDLQEAGFMEGERSCPHFFGSLLQTEGVSTEQIVGLTTELFTAGIDSTANALAFALYNLSRHPEKQARLRRELLAVLPPGCALTPESLDQLHYLKACVKESFRLNFPIEGGTTRILSKDVELSGYTAPKNVLIALNNQTMCLQEEFFQHSEEYVPERWLKGNQFGSHHPPPPRFVMLPFGHGPRMCIGRRFAEQEIYLALVKIFQTFRTEYQGEKVNMINRVFTMPDKPITIKFIELQ